MSDITRSSVFPYAFFTLLRETRLLVANLTLLKMPRRRLASFKFIQSFPLYQLLVVFHFLFLLSKAQSQSLYSFPFPFPL